MPWTWLPAQQDAFARLKHALTEAPALSQPDFGQPFVIQIDASDFAITAVLTQEVEDGENPIVFVSRVVTAAEKNYIVTEKECLAVPRAIDKLRPYVEDTFKVITDHSFRQSL